MKTACGRRRSPASGSQLTSQRQALPILVLELDRPGQLRIRAPERHAQQDCRSPHALNEPAPEGAPTSVTCKRRSNDSLDVLHMWQTDSPARTRQIAPTLTDNQGMHSRRDAQSRPRRLGKPDCASGRQPFHASAAFDLDRRNLSWIDADLRALPADPYVQVVTTVMDREPQCAK
jgi:hypothetical protein